MANGVEFSRAWRWALAGATIGAANGLLEWAIEWGRLLGRDFPWTLEADFLRFLLGLTAYGVALYLLAGTSVGALVGFAMSRGLRFLPAGKKGLAHVLLPVLLALSVFPRVWLFVNQEYLPGRFSAPSLIANVALVMAALILLLVLSKLVAGCVGNPRGGAVRAAEVILLILWGVGLSIGATAVGVWNATRPATSQHRHTENKPNVLVLLLETTRADHVGCYGYNRDTTPNVDELASEGVLFENYYTAAPFSGPSKATLHTGRYPHIHGVRTMPQRIRKEVPKLAEVFLRNGYATAGFASGNFMGPQYNYHGGFQTYECLGVPYDSFRFVTVLRGLELALHRYTPWYKTDEERYHIVDARGGVSKALDWIDHRNGAPFFCLLEFNEPHMYYDPPPPFRTKFIRTLPEHTLLDDIKAGRVARFDVVYAFDQTNYGPEDVEQAMALYDGEIAYVDWAIGNLVKGLRERGVLDRTVLLVTADHGENFGEHGTYFTHQHLYEQSLHVPMILRYPARLESRRIQSLVQEVDVFPTLIELAGIDYRGPLDGVSMLRKLEADSSNYPIFAEGVIRRNARLNRYRSYRINLPGVAGKWRMVRDGNWKLICIPTPSGDEYELYDVAHDPMEQVNLYLEQKGIADRLRLRLDEWIAMDPRAERDLDYEMLRVREKKLRSLGYVE